MTLHDIKLLGNVFLDKKYDKKFCCIMLFISPLDVYIISNINNNDDDDDADDDVSVAVLECFMMGRVITVPKQLAHWCPRH